MVGQTTIMVTESQADELHARKKRGEAYRHVIERLLDRDDDGTE